MLLATALNIPPHTVKSSECFSQQWQTKLDSIASLLTNPPIWQWNMLHRAVSCVFFCPSHGDITPIYTVHPHLLWGRSSSYGVLCLYPPYSSNKLNEKRGEAQPIMDHIVCLAISVSRTQQFNTFSIKYSLYPLALSSYVSWHFYQALKWFQPGWHSAWVRPIFLRDFQHVLEHFITASPRVAGDVSPASSAANQPVGPFFFFLDHSNVTWLIVLKWQWGLVVSEIRWIQFAIHVAKWISPNFTFDNELQN